MSNLQTGDASHHNNAINQLPIGIESELRFPLDSSVRIVFTGRFNGYGVEVQSPEEMTLLYHMGCFGKGTFSRSKPAVAKKHRSTMMRKRQFRKRMFWHKKFALNSAKSDDFLKDVDNLTCKILSDSNNEINKDVIDLVSSEEELSNDLNEEGMNSQLLDRSANRDNIVIIVPNSDSEGENYFENFKPKCCINYVTLNEKLMLTLEEALFLVYGLGCLQIFDSENKLLTLEQCWQLFRETDKNFVLKYVVYHYFRSKGYIVKSGIKYGGDYLLYREGPSVNHADYIVVIKKAHDVLKDSWNSTLGHVRMASTTVKEILIAEVNEIVQISEEEYSHPDTVKNFSVREILLTRNIPMPINDD